MARANAARHQRHLQGVGAIGASNDMFHAQIFTKLLFELSHFRAQNVTAFRNNLGNGGIKTVFDTRALRSKINELHVGSNLSGSPYQKRIHGNLFIPSRPALPWVERSKFC